MSANLVTPLFEAGRRKAEVARTRAVLEERVAAYGQVVLRAMVEVQNALAQVHAQTQITTELGQELVAARDSLQAAQNDFVAGQVEYLTVLDAIRRLQGIQLDELRTRGQVIAARVQLFRALGGRWTQGLTRPEPLTDKGFEPPPRLPSAPLSVSSSPPHPSLKTDGS